MKYLIGVLVGVSVGIGGTAFAATKVQDITQIYSVPLVKTIVSGKNTTTEVDGTVYKFTDKATGDNCYVYTGGASSGAISCVK